jgi:tetratricopeptide (TPR) repeat protein
VRYGIYAKAGRWDGAVEIARTMARSLPDNPWGPFHLAFSLHELKRTQEAYDVVRVVVDKFPEHDLMRYNLACYSCQLGNLKESLTWLEKAIDLAGKKDIRLMALEDPDLEPLWAKIGEIWFYENTKRPKADSLNCRAKQGLKEIKSFSV